MRRPTARDTVRDDVTAVGPHTTPVPAPTVPAESASQAQRRPAAFRPDIEGLRGVAVLCVVLYHAWPAGVAGGFVGVDVFFALSGYLITGLLVAEYGSSGRIALGDFYARRVRRLLPASTLMLVVTLVGASLLLSPVELGGVYAAGLAVSLYASNLWLLRQSTDYFAADQGANPLLHTWSLAVEEQFYFVWPVLVLGALRLGTRMGRQRAALAAVLGVVSLVSLVGGIWLTGYHQPYAFFGTPARAWEFGLGGLAALLPVGLLTRHRGVVRAAGWLGAACIAVSAGAYSAGILFPGAAALLPVLGTIGVLVAGTPGVGAGVPRFLLAAPLQHLGRLSYAWYLWHWPALVLAQAAVPSLPTTARIAVAVLALLPAQLSFTWLESPVRRSRWLSARPARAFALAGGLAAVGITGALWIRAHARAEASSPAQWAVASAAARRTATDVPRCTSEYLDTTLRECVLGDSAGSTTVVLVGDSHASQWAPALDDVARGRGWRVVTLLKSSCAVAAVPVYAPHLRRPYHECEAWRRSAIARVVALRPAAVVVSQYAMAPADVDWRGERVPPGEAEWREGMTTSLRQLAASGASVVVLRDTPRPGFDVPTCLSRALARATDGRDASATCSVPRSVALQEAAARAERAAAGAVGARVVDLTDRICGPRLCEPVVDGVVVYRDWNHLTVDFAERLTQDLAVRLGGITAR